MDRNARFLHCFLDYPYIVGVKMIRIHKITIELWRLDWTKAEPISQLTFDMLDIESLESFIQRGFIIKPRSEFIGEYDDSHN